MSLSRLRSLASRAHSLRPTFTPSRHPAPRLFQPSRQPFSSSLRHQQRYGQYGSSGGGPQQQGFWTRDRTVKLAVGASGAGGAYYVYHLEKVPETGRYRFMDMSPEQETELAKQSFDEIMSQYSHQILPGSHPLTRYCQNVAGRIIDAARLGWVVAPGASGTQQGQNVFFGGLPGVDGPWGDDASGSSGSSQSIAAGEESEWEIFVIDEPKTRNAFVIPGRKIFVFTGILPICSDEDGLASVLGHEIAHQVVRHGAERMSSMKVIFFLGILLEFLGYDPGLTNLGLTYLMQLPNSRKQETEADQVGLRLMAQACFDPRQAAAMWTRMKDAEPKSSLGFAGADFGSTHPSNEKRIKNMEQWMPEALDIRAASPCGNDLPSRFEDFKEATNSQFVVKSRLPSPSPTRTPSPLPSQQVDKKPVSDVDEKWAKWL